MPIQADNLKFYRAATMDSASPLNGGMPSSVEIIDGASNQLFEDISETQRAGGALEFAKVYGAVRTASTDVLRGANMVISDAPDDPYASVVMFAASSVAETQADVIARIGGVSGSISASDRSKINPSAYVEIMTVTSGGAVGDSPYGLCSLRLTEAQYGIAETVFAAGTRITFVEFYENGVIKSETREIATLTKPLPVMIYVGGSVAYKYGVVLTFTSASAYPRWGAATEFKSAADAANHKLNGTYITDSTAIATTDFSYFGVSTLTAAAAAGATTLAVASTTAPVVPLALVDSPEAQAILGFEPRLLSRAPDGREPIFETGRFVVVGKDVTHGPSSYSPGTTINLGEGLLKRVKIVGADGARITAGWTADLDAGTVTIGSVTGWSMPARIIARAEDMALVSAVGASSVTIGKGLSRAYPAGSSVSAALVLGDIRARLVTLFDQEVWSNVWSDALIGSAAGGQYNINAYPLGLTNDGAITERWRIHFTSSTAFYVAGESVGQIATGTTTADCAPINPATGQPYFTLAALGWGSGWSVGNVLRFNTAGAMPPVWLLRCVQQSPETTASDSFEIAFRGGVNRP